MPLHPTCTPTCTLLAPFRPASFRSNLRPDSGDIPNEREPRRAAGLRARPKRRPPGTELSTVTADAGGADALLARAGAILRARAADAPEGFAAHLFDGAAAEDLVRYEAAELADIAAASWRFLAERNPGMPKIRVTTAPPDDGPRLKDVSVIELVNDDMPFLVDSVTGALTERGLDTHLVVHPVFAVERDPTGALTGLSGGTDAPSAVPRESVIQIHVDRIDDEAARADLIAALTAVLGDVRHAVEDWRLMVDRVAALIATLKGDPPALPGDEVAEAIQFLEWLRDDNFTFLGIRDYRLEAGGESLAAVPELLARRPARRRRRGHHRRGRQGRIVAAGTGRFQGAPAASHHQDQSALAGAPAGRNGSRRGQALRP